MSKKLIKEHRYAMRLEEGMYQRLREISFALHTPLPELLCVGAMLLFAQASTPAAFESMKRGIFVDDATNQMRVPPNLDHPADP